MGKLKKIFKSWRVILLLACLLTAAYALYPNPWAEGVTIRSVTDNSSAAIAGIKSPLPKAPPMSKERIEAIEYQGKKTGIGSEKDYHSIISVLEADDSVRIITNRQAYLLKVLPETETIITDELVEKEEPITIETVVEEDGKNVTNVAYVTKNITKTVNETLLDEAGNATIFQKEVTFAVNETRTVLVNRTETRILGVQDIGLNIYTSPKTNIRKGLDLQGGTRVLLEPEKQLSSDDMEILKLNMERRLNVFGLSDVGVRVIHDQPLILGGVPKYISVEIPGANEKEVKELLSRQGKFEAKIKNDTVFRGGQDITYVCRSANCAGIDPNTGCNQVQGGYACRFRFSITLKPEAAQRQADLTKELSVIRESREGYLSEPLKLYLDDVEVDSLNIGQELRGRAVTEISITGGGSGPTYQNAVANTLDSMKRLQTVLITGSLPVKMNIVKADNISPVLGEKFVRNAILTGIIALLAVACAVFIRYREIRVAVPMVLILASEVLLVLGLAAFIGWNLDLAAIAGIIIATGTGVDHLILITDEALGRKEQYSSWKDKLKKAFFIIMAAYFTTLVAMMPLMFAGAGLLKGFAITTIAGVSIGVFIARPAFARIIEVLLE